MATSLEKTLEGLPLAYRGPGGAAAVLREGRVIAKRAWGWADAEQRTPFTTASLFRVCSITKQFVCGLLLGMAPDPSELDGAVRSRLPRLTQPSPTTLQLCHNQSGLRDYWALGMLHGALPETPVGTAEATLMIGQAWTLQFQPGARYSYANQNFRLIGDMLEVQGGASLDELLRQRLFDRVGMPSARMAADTAACLDGVVGYEGDEDVGFRRAENRIVWTGDAGMAASLDDMIAWEGYIDAGLDASDSLYDRLSAPVAFSDGRPSNYGFGLRRGMELGRAVTGHGGGLRGWRSYRLHAPRERISVVVLFNHMADAHAAAVDLFAATLGETRAQDQENSAPDSWAGRYIDPGTKLLARIESAAGGLTLHYSAQPERLVLTHAREAQGGGVRVYPTGNHLIMDRTGENLRARLRSLGAIAPLEIAGLYHCEEIDAHLTIEVHQGVAYGAFSGFLGSGRMEQLDPVGETYWALPCPRALDYSPPGDWTLAFSGADTGAATHVTVGCWLARGLRYRRIE